MKFDGFRQKTVVIIFKKDHKIDKSLPRSIENQGRRHFVKEITGEKTMFQELEEITTFLVQSLPTFF